MRDAWRTKAYGAHLGPIAIPAKERQPRHVHENFYWLQEDYLRERQRGQAWRWTILRPQVIFGESLGSHMNLIPAIGVYAALLREAGRPLAFPGGPPWVREAVDADLLARACAWAATSAACANEIFNINNGDVFEWRHVWPAIAGTLGMEVGPDEPMSLDATLPPREAEWRAIVRKYGLRAPATFAEFVGQGFVYADAQLAYGAKRPPSTTLVSTIKARQRHELAVTYRLRDDFLEKLRSALPLPIDCLTHTNAETNRVKRMTTTLVNPRRWRPPHARGLQLSRIRFQSRRQI